MFRGEAYSVVGGTAMGQRHSVVLANIFMAYFFDAFFTKHPLWKPHIPCFKRFLDDVFLFFKGSWQQYQSLIETINVWSRANGWIFNWIRYSLVAE